MPDSRCGKQHGPRRSRISVAAPWAGDAPQHDLLQLCQSHLLRCHQLLHPHHRPHHHPRRHPRHHTHCHLLVQCRLVLWTHSIAPWVMRTLGQQTRSRGVAEFTTVVAHPQHRHLCHQSSQSCHRCQLRHHPRQTHTIALTGSRIGRLDGVCRRRSGAAESTARVALVKRREGVPLRGPPLRHTIAMPGSQIGWQGGR